MKSLSPGKPNKYYKINNFKKEIRMDALSRKRSEWDALERVQWREDTWSNQQAVSVRVGISAN